MKMTLLFLLMSVASVSIAGQSMTAQETLKHSFELYRSGVNCEREVLEITISGAKRPTANKTFIRKVCYGEYGDGGEPRDRASITVDASSRFGEEGLELRIARREGSDLIKTNSGSRGKFRAISGQNEDKYFAFTDITKRDAVQLLGEDLNGYDYTFLDSSGDNVKYVIEAQPKDAIVPVYSRRVFFVGEKGQILKVRYYTGATVQKVQRNALFEYAENGRWRANKIVIKNRRPDRKTVVEISRRDFTDAFNSPFFSGG